ncbi:hypothetical protein FIBSPDRAFT_865344 [Athelia psychrophila]|uniref:Uncharacterized protein n=1 Tax=Athelia psychrophila TaxID=1759441 RepID=A0A166FNJ6_9AGAM|nr:hypothetical protein FIBSPDRAFT_865344 [Fibularhizoctonia sp. CBS 109695]
MPPVDLADLELQMLAGKWHDFQAAPLRSMRSSDDPAASLNSKQIFIFRVRRGVVLTAWIPGYKFQARRSRVTSI